MRGLVFSTGRSLLRSTPKPTFEETYKSSIDNCASNTGLPRQWRTPRFATLLSKLGGYPLERQLLKACRGWSCGCPSGTFVGDSGAAS